MNLLPGTVRITTALGSLYAISTTDSNKESIRAIRIFNINIVSAAAVDIKFHNLNRALTSSTSEWLTASCNSGTGATAQGTTINYYDGIRFPLGCWAYIPSSLVYATITYTEEF
jgi:hypothetical protein